MTRSMKPRSRARHGKTLDVNDNRELCHWAAQFDVDPDIVRYAVEIMGPDVEDVRRYVELFLRGIRRPAKKHLVSYKR